MLDFVREGKRVSGGSLFKYLVELFGFIGWDFYRIIE